MKALLVIDAQEGLLKGSYDETGVLARIKGLIERARNAGVPVIYVRHDEAIEYDGPIHADIAPLEGETVVPKMTPNSFHDTNLKEVLDALKIDETVLVGMQTEMCIDTTTRAAWDKGYKVTVVSDAHTTVAWDGSAIPPEQVVAHHNAVLRMFADVKPAAEITF
jgi:nicotinamidase-related amidase